MLNSNEPIKDAHIQKFANQYAVNIKTFYESQKTFVVRESDIRTVKNIFLLKLQIPENHSKLDVSKNSKVVYRRLSTK